MKYDILRPIIMTIIAIGILKTAKERTELLNGNLWLWFILIIFVASWVGFLCEKTKRIKLSRNYKPKYI